MKTKNKQSALSNKDLLENLSPISLEMSLIIGMKKTLWLSRRLGGMVFYISNLENSESFTSISKEIGKEAAKKICDYFKGTWLYIPKNEVFFKNFREKLLLEQLLTGAINPQTIRFLALKFDFTHPALLFGRRFIENTIKNQ